MLLQSETLNWLSTCFWPFFISTSVLSVSFSVKKVNLEDGAQVKLDIWDTAGAARFDSLSSKQCDGAHAIIVVYDITEEPSFERAKNWVRKVQEMAIPNIFLALVGNKADLEANRKVKREVVCLKFFMSSNCFLCLLRPHSVKCPLDILTKERKPSISSPSQIRCLFIL